MDKVLGEIWRQSAERADGQRFPSRGKPRPSDLKKIAEEMRRFDPTNRWANCPFTHLREIERRLAPFRDAGVQERVCLLSKCPAVKPFLFKQPSHVMTDYKQLGKALVKEFATFAHVAFEAARLVKQRVHEHPHMYIERLRTAYRAWGFWDGNDVNIRTLFLENLHHATKSDMPSFVDQTMFLKELLGLATTAYDQGSERLRDARQAAHAPSCGTR